MRLISLKVSSFASIRQAKLEFCPGLNVVYGPNELGKSTLVDAIRAALLTPFSSTAHQKWCSWHDDSPPEVELVLQSEEQRFWRARKTFASNGSASLDESSDGVSFHNLASQRAVDGELRQLLKWGLKQPGGRGGARGIPETFMSAVLLPGQAEATKVFDRTLQEDEDESARAMLKDALETLAADPILLSAIKATQARVDEAFTATGRKRTGKNSPFAQASELVRELNAELDKVRKQHENTGHLREKLSTLTAQRSRQQANVDRLRAHLERARLWEQAKQRRDSLLAQRQQLQTQQQQLAQQRQQLEEVEGKLETAKLQRQAAGQAEKAAVSELEAVRSEHSPEQRRAQLAEAQAELAKAQNQRDRLTTQLARAKQLAQCRGQQQRCEQALDEIRRNCDQLDQQHQQAEQLVQVLVAQQRLAELTACRAETERLRQDIADAQQAASSLDELDQKIQSLKKQIEAAPAPTDDQLSAIGQLDQQLAVARGQLEAGLTVEVDPPAPLELQVSKDDEPPETLRVDAASEITAKRKAVLSHPLLGTVTIRAGDKAAQLRLAELERQWSAVAQPVLDRCGCGSLSELQQRRKTADQQRGEVEDLTRRREAAQAAAMRQQELASQLTAAQQRFDELTERWEACAERPRRDAEARQQTHPLDAQRLQRDREAAANEAEQQRAKLSDQKSNLSVAEEKLAAATQRVAETLAAVGDEESSVETCQQKLQASQALLDELKAKVDALGDAEPPEIAAATQAVADAKAASEQAAAEVDTLEQKWRECRDATKTAEGVLATLQQAFSQSDWDAADAELTRIESEAEAAGERLRPVAEVQVDFNSQQAELDSLSSELRDTELSLNVHGGPGLDERLEELEEAVARASAEEQRLIEDYEAWRLLNETLKEVERTESSNLGNSLRPELSSLISELTGGVHSGVELGADLELLGIESRGARRNLQQLSIGMQDQFATLLRVHLAAQLGHFVVLDDQLVQSDPTRMQWLRSFLADRSQRCQITIFTCRPQDYEFADPCATTDLQQVVQSY